LFNTPDFFLKQTNFTNWYTYTTVDKSFWQKLQLFKGFPASKITYKHTRNVKELDGQTRPWNNGHIYLISRSRIYHIKYEKNL
jgi:hypothetical protein